MENQIANTQNQIQGIGYDLNSIAVTQKSKNAAYCTITRFGKYTEKFTVELTATGKVKKNSIRFYDTY